VGVVDEDVVDVVLEDRGFTGGGGVSSLEGYSAEVVACLLYCREVASGEDVQQRCLAASTVAAVISSVSWNATQYCMRIVARMMVDIQQYQLPLHGLRASA
jgi:hypothetical protein